MAKTNTNIGEKRQSDGIKHAKEHQDQQPKPKRQKQFQQDIRVFTRTKIPKCGMAEPVSSQIVADKVETFESNIAEPSNSDPQSGRTEPGKVSVPKCGITESMCVPDEADREKTYESGTAEARNSDHQSGRAEPGQAEVSKCGKTEFKCVPDEADKVET